MFVGRTTALQAQDRAHAARLSYIEGEVSVELVDTAGATLAQVNMPLLEGARVTTANGQAEIELEDGSVVRLTPRTAVAVTRLTSGAEPGVLTVLNGLAYAELRVTGNAPTAVIEVGSDSIIPLSNAALRVQFDQPPPAIAVLLGTLRVEHAGADAFDISIQEGEWLQELPQGDRSYTLTQAIPYDSWDDWNEHRAQTAMDQAADRTTARDGYAGDQGYGWSDLDSSGFWYDVTGQGLVWQPYDAAAAGFDPYAYGSWAYAGGAGYVWASSYAWGWVPYHCGSWAYSNSFGWGWSPGTACDLGGWYSGVGHGVNVTRSPPGYHRPLPPDPHGPPRAHPILVTSTPRPAPEWDVQRRLGEVPALPLRPIASAPVTRGASAVGAALNRDFPIDRGTHQPVLGVTRAPVSPPQDGRAPASVRPVPAVASGSRAPSPGTLPAPRPAWDPAAAAAIAGRPRPTGLPSGLPAPTSSVFPEMPRMPSGSVTPVRPASAPIHIAPSSPAPAHVAPPPPPPAAAPAKK